MLVSKAFSSSFLMSRSETLGRVIYVGNVHNLGVLKVASEGAVFRGWGWLLFFFFICIVSTSSGNGPVSFLQHML